MKTSILILVLLALTLASGVKSRNVDVGSVPVATSVQQGVLLMRLDPPTPRGFPAWFQDYNLIYSSASSRSLAGEGWSLDSLSMITRCPSSFGIDGAAKEIQNNIGDFLCFDGQRLHVVFGSYWSVGSVYRTEIETFNKIVAAQTSDGTLYFVVYTKDNRIFTYGLRHDARFLVAGNTWEWRVDSMADQFGCKINVSYFNSGSAIYLSNVSYSDVAIRYNYEKRVDVSTTYYGGAVARIDNMRLSSIEAIKTAVVEKSLLLQYSSDSSRRSVLTSVKMCTNSSCLNPTTFQYTGTIERSVDSPTMWTSEFGEYRGWDSRMPRTFADVNNDGLPDVVAFGSHSIYVSLNRNGSSFHSSSNYLPFDHCTTCFTLNGGWDGSYLRDVVDVNGDGLPDVLGVLSGSSGNIRVSLNAGNLRFTTMGSSATGLGGTGTFKPIVRDFNGDGLVDILHRDNDHYLYVALNNFVHTGTWKSIASWNNYQSLYSLTRSYTEPFFVGDVNGDTLPDVVAFTTSASGVLLFINTGSSFATPVGLAELCWSQNWRVEWDKRMLADVNGDGMEDIIAVHRTGVTNVSLSHGSRFGASTTWLIDAGISVVDPWNTQVVVQDVNADSLADLVLITSTTVRVALNSGQNSFESPIIWLLNHTMSVNSTYVIDVTGDNVADFVSFSPSGVVVARNRNSAMRLQSAVDGLGLETKAVYSTTADSRVYLRSADYPSSTYPLANVNVRQTLVSQVLTDDGIGGMNVSSYTYEDIRYDLTGRSRPAFARITEWQNAGRETIAHEYFQDFPLTAAVKSLVRTVDRQLVAQSDFTHVVSSVSHQQTGGKSQSVYTVNLAVTVGEERDLSRRLLKLKTSETQFDNFGNALSTNLTLRSGSLWYNRITTVTHVTPDTESWIINQPLNIKETYTVPGKKSITRSVAMTYYGNRKLHRKIEEPDSRVGLVTMYSYDQCGRVTEELTRPVAAENEQSDRFTTYHYSTTGSGYPDFIDRITDVFGKTVAHYRYDRFGNVVAATDVNDLTTTFTYDSWRRKTAEFRPDGINVTIEYAFDNSLPLASYRVVRRETLKPTETKIVDKLDRPIRVITQGFNGDDVYVDIEYDKFGRVVRQSYPYYPSRRTATFVRTEHDLLGRTAKRTDEATNSTVRTLYNGFETTTIDSTGSKRVRVSDPFGRVVSVVDENGGKLQLSYDAVGNLVETVDPSGNVIMMQYDERGNKVSLTDPNMGSWHYYYNAFGETIETLDAKSQKTTLQYDRLGRAVARNDSETGVLFTYNTGANNQGQRTGLSTMQSSNGYQRVFSYDSLGQLSRESRLIDGIWHNRTMAYNARKLVSAVHNNGTALFYCYNPRGFLLAIRSDSNCSNSRGDKRDYWRAIAYSAQGEVEKERAGNGVVTSYARDAAGRVLSIQSLYGNIMLRDWQYEYDAASNMKTRRDAAPQFNTVEDFRYDALRRLVRARIRDADDDFYDENSESWSYDATGNILEYNGYNAEYLKYSYDAVAAPNAVTKAGPNVYAYDANGNMVARNAKAISWTVDNRLKWIDTPAGRSVYFDYDPQSGLRYRKVLYAGAQSAPSAVVRTNIYFDHHFETVSASGSSSTAFKTYVYAFDRLVAVQTVAGNSSTVLYMHSDHLGSIDTITGSTGEVVEAVRYTPFGRVRKRLPNASQSLSSRYFVSHESLNEDGLGLIHMSGRVYDPVIGRFLSPDIVVQGMLNPASYNRYSYCVNNPLSYKDPSGYFFGKLFRAVLSIFNPRNLIPLLVGGLVTAFAGPIVGGIVSGGLSGLLNTGTVAGAVKGAVLGGLSGAVSSGITAVGNAISQSATSSLGKTLSSVLSAATNTPIGRIATSAVSGGVVEQLNGGQFEDGLARGLVNELRSTVKYDIDARSGGEAGDNGYNEAAPVKGANVGTQGPVDPNSWFGEGGRISRFLNNIPGVNAVAGNHEYMQIHLKNPMRDILNMPLMVPAYAITMLGMMDQVYLYDQGE